MTELSFSEKLAPAKHVELTAAAAPELIAANTNMKWQLDECWNANICQVVRRVCPQLLMLNSIGPIKPPRPDNENYSGHALPAQLTY